MLIFSNTKHTKFIWTPIYALWGKGESCMRIRNLMIITRCETLVYEDKNLSYCEFPCWCPSPCPAYMRIQYKHFYLRGNSLLFSFFQSPSTCSSDLTVLHAERNKDILMSFKMPKWSIWLNNKLHIKMSTSSLRTNPKKIHLNIGC